MPALAGAFAQGTLASRPTAAAGLEGYYYLVTDQNGGTLFQCKSSAWVQVTTGVSAVQPTGLTGATAATRCAGGTTSGAPVSGTFAVGDFVIDQTGKVWICTVAGTPGTWAAGSGGGVTSLTGTANQIIFSASTGAVTASTPQSIGPTSSPTFASIAAGGLTGATSASRYVGATASGAPASGTFLTGDWSIDLTGKVWICTSGGSPGTWAQVGGSGGSTALTNLGEVIVAGSVAASVSFSSISGSYRNLLLLATARGDTAAYQTDALVQFNGDTGSNYDYVDTYIYTSGVNGVNAAASSSINAGKVLAASNPANVAGSLRLTVYDYARTVWYKPTDSQFMYASSNNFSNDTLTGSGNGRWVSTAAITSILVKPAAGNFAIGSVFTLWGIV